MKNLCSKMNSIPLAAKAAFWFTICNLFLKGINFLSAFLFAWVLPEAENGLLSVFVSYEQIVIIIATWEIHLGAYTRGLFKYKDDTDNFTVSMQALVNVITLVFFLLVFSFNRMVTSFTGMTLPTLLALLSFSLFKPAFNAWITRKRVKYDYRPAILLTLGYSIACVAIPFVSVLLFGRTARIKYLATLLTSTVICFLLWVRHANYRTLFLFRDKVKEYWKFMLRYEGPLVLHSLSFLILNHSDRIMIGKMVGNGEAAFYSTAYSIAIVITLLQSSVDQALGPWRYQKLDEGKFSDIKKVTTWLLIGYGLVVFAFVIVAPDIVRLFFPPSYAVSIWCIPPITVSAYFMFLYSIFVGVETYYEKTQYVLYVSLSCGIINLILNYFGIRMFGYIACAYATLISYVLFSIGHYLFMKRTLKMNHVAEPVVSIKVIVVISAILVALSILVSFLYNTYLPRYMILIAILIAAFCKRKKLISMYHNYF